MRDAWSYAAAATGVALALRQSSALAAAGRPGTPFRYTAEARFDGNSGSGKRNERRACALTFGKG